MSSVDYSQIARLLRVDGAFFARDSIRRWLTRNSLSRIDQLFAHPRAVSTRHIGRAVYAVELPDENGEPCELFVKLQWGRRPLFPRIADLTAGTLFRPLPHLEWCGQQAFREAGLNVPEGLALFHEGTLRSFRSGIVMRATPARLSIHDLLRFHQWLDIPPRDRSKILHQVAEITHHIQAKGLAWRGISCKHFLPEQRPDGTWRQWLLDCEGVEPLANSRMLQRDLRKLFDSFGHMGADEETQAEIHRLLYDSTGQNRVAA